MSKAMIVVGRAPFTCEWGVTVVLPQDREPCARRARQMIAVHIASNDVRHFRLCDLHAEIVTEETVPHVED